MAENINWLTLTPTAGTSGLTNVTMTSNACPQRTSRKAVITFKAGDNLTRKVTVVQNGSVVDYGDRLKAKKIGNIIGVSATQIMINFGVASSTNPEGATYFYKVSTNATEEYAANSGWKSIHATATSITETISLSVGSEAYVHSAAVKETSSNVEHKMFTHRPKLNPVTNFEVVESRVHSVSFRWVKPNNISTIPGYTVYTGTSSASCMSTTTVYKNNAETPLVVRNNSNPIPPGTVVWIGVEAFYQGYENSDRVCFSGKTAEMPMVSITPNPSNATINYGERITLTFKKLKWDETLYKAQVLFGATEGTPFSVISSSTVGGINIPFDISTNTADVSQWTTTDDYVLVLESTMGINRNIDMTVTTRTNLREDNSQLGGDEQLTVRFNGNEYAELEPSLTILLETLDGEIEIGLQDSETLLGGENGAQKQYNLTVKAVGEHASLTYSDPFPGQLSSYSIETNVETETVNEITLTIFQTYNTPTGGSFTIVVWNGSEPNDDPNKTITRTVNFRQTDRRSDTLTVTPNPLSVAATDAFIPSGLTRIFTVESDMEWAISAQTGDVSWFSLKLEANNTPVTVGKSNVQPTRIPAGNNIQVRLTAQQNINSVRSITLTLYHVNGNKSVNFTVNQTVNWAGGDGQSLPYVYIEPVEWESEDIDIQEGSEYGLQKIDIPTSAEYYSLSAKANVWYRLFVETNGDEQFVFFDEDYTSPESATILDSEKNDIMIYTKELTTNTKRTNQIKVKYATGEVDANGAYIFYNSDEDERYSSDRLGVLELTQDGRQSSTNPFVYVRVTTTNPSYNSEGDGTVTKSWFESNAEEPGYYFYTGANNQPLSFSSAQGQALNLWFTVLVGNSLQITQTANANTLNKLSCDEDGLGSFHQEDSEPNKIRATSPVVFKFHADALLGSNSATYSFKLLDGVVNVQVNLEVVAQNESHGSTITAYVKCHNYERPRIRVGGQDVDFSNTDIEQGSAWELYWPARFEVNASSSDEYFGSAILIEFYDTDGDHFYITGVTTPSKVTNGQLYTPYTFTNDWDDRGLDGNCNITVRAKAKNGSSSSAASFSNSEFNNFNSFGRQIWSGTFSTLSEGFPYSEQITIS